ncbi:MAG TPA: DNA alkylation repair protein [Kofleriaceae bacterium]|nr:DNA alkylation repair protein [Kofleriaceae bacterium]
MVVTRRSQLDPVADLRRRLSRDGGGSERTRSAPAAAALRSIVRRWWSDHGLASHPATVGKRVALALIDHPPVAELAAISSQARGTRRHLGARPRRLLQLSGIIVLHELLADHLRASDLPRFAEMFAHGAFDDAAIVDAFGVKVLGTLLGRVRGRAEAARLLAQWRTADTVWQRRAACVAFTVLAPQGDSAHATLAQQIFALCGAVVWSPERLDQTGVGWLLRELSRAEPTRVEAFVRRHARFMSRECITDAIDRLAVDRQRDLLAAWKRATTIRR